jgi:hypothetical protein
MAGFPFPHPMVGPSNDAAVAGGEQVFRVESGLRRPREELLPEASDRGLPDQAGTVRRRPRVLEHTIARHALHDALDIVTIECLVEAFDDGPGVLGDEVRRLFKRGPFSHAADMLLRIACTNATCPVQIRAKVL